MALFVNKNDNRSELQRRIEAEIREKAKNKPQMDFDEHDGVEDSAFVDGTKQTSSILWAWILVIILGIGAVAFLISVAMHRNGVF